MILQRVEYGPDGIFGVLRHGPEEIAKTLEHAYINARGDEFLPKIPDGRYRCVRGIHQLHRSGPFETFEVTGVPGHTGILFHVGNYNRDSSGCILLGKDFGDKMLLRSKTAFFDFMTLLKDVSDFDLEVV